MGFWPLEGEIASSDLPLRPVGGGERSPSITYKAKGNVLLPAVAVSAQYAVEICSADERAKGWIGWENFAFKYFSDCQLYEEPGSGTSNSLYLLPLSTPPSHVIKYSYLKWKEKRK